jgi:hypothetical protein
MALHEKLRFSCSHAIGAFSGTRDTYFEWNDSCIYTNEDNAFVKLYFQHSFIRNVYLLFAVDFRMSTIFLW